LTKVLMYCTRFCAYCHLADRLLDRKGVAAQKIYIDEAPELRRVMEAATKRRTVPQIFIGDNHIGGYWKLAALEREGSLDRLLQSGEN
jgi:glutaredoxin 3